VTARMTPSPSSTRVALRRGDPARHRAVRPCHRASPESIEECLDHLSLAIDGIVGRYEREGPQRLSSEAVAVRKATQDLLADPRAKGSQRRACVIAGQASGLLSYMAINASRFAHANAYAQEAFELAAVAGERSLQAWVRGTQSLGAYYRSDFSSALQFAEDGLRITVNAGQASRLWINGQARALAKLGRIAEAEDAIDKALHAAERTSTPTGISPCISLGAYSHSRIAANAATDHLSLGNAQQVLDHARQI
jgi:tetratricopeptide (TPR) repeat protein